jgi:hypothetical protein
VDFSVKPFLAAFFALAAGLPLTDCQPVAGSGPPSSTPKSATPQPPQETLRDLRIAVAQGRLKDAPALCDRLQSAYEEQRGVVLKAVETPTTRAQASVETYMACYCIYSKSQVQAFSGDFPGAEATLLIARNFRSRYPEFKNPRIRPILDNMDSLTAGLINERSGKLDAAVQTYLPATYQSGAESPLATGRLAMIELKRGHTDKAQSWAYIHADDPTSQFVLAQLALQKKNSLVAQRHATTALNLIQKQLKDGKEYMPVYFAEAPAIRALSKMLPPLPPPPAKPAPPKPANQNTVPPKAPAPATSGPSAEKMG